MNEQTVIFKGLQTAANTIKLHYSWLNQEMDIYEFKILIMVAVLKENSVAFDGTIDTMCEWLGVSRNARNRQKIGQALDLLEKKGLILQTLKADRRIIYITEFGMSSEVVIQAKKEWIAAFKRYNRDVNGKVISANRSVDWINTLKVFMFICGFPYTEDGRLFGEEAVYTNALIAAKLNIPSRTVKRAVKALIECDTPLLKIERHMLKYKTLDNQWRNLGSRFDLGVDFS